MVAATQDLPQKSLQIKEDDKFFTRLMSKETSAANSSCRVYYGGASGAIPFTWESQPGTPKHPLGEISLPPLTPPPSYQSNLARSSSKTSIQRKTKNRNVLLSMIFTSFDLKKNCHVSPTSSSWSSTSSSSSSSSSWSSPRFGKARHFPSRSSIPIRYDVDDNHDHDDDDHDDDYQGDNRGHRSPTSTLCFGVYNNKKQQKSRSHGGEGCYSMGKMKNALLSIVGP